MSDKPNTLGTSLDRLVASLDSLTRLLDTQIARRHVYALFGFLTSVVVLIIGAAAIVTLSLSNIPVPLALYIGLGTVLFLALLTTVFGVLMAVVNRKQNQLLRTANHFTKGWYDMNHRLCEITDNILVLADRSEFKRLGKEELERLIKSLRIAILESICTNFDSLFIEEDGIPPFRAIWLEPFLHINAGKQVLSLRATDWYPSHPVPTVSKLSGGGFSLLVDSLINEYGNTKLGWTPSMYLLGRAAITDCVMDEDEFLDFTKCHTCPSCLQLPITGSRKKKYGGCILVLNERRDIWSQLKADSGASPTLSELGFFTMLTRGAIIPALLVDSLTVHWLKEQVTLVTELLDAQASRLISLRSKR